MNAEEPASGARELPRFFVEWRTLFGQAGADFTPVDYLNQPAGPPFVIAAQWLFCPEFVEYRGCVVMAHRLDAKVLDEWFVELDGEVSRIEAVANLVSLYDVFTACDVAAYEADLSRLARAIARCWRGVLRMEYPERDFQVEVYDDERSHGPEITFFSGRPQG